MPRVSAVLLGTSRAVKLAAKKVDHKGKMFTHIPAQMAAAGPPLGSQLGQIGVNIPSFIKGESIHVERTRTLHPCLSLQTST